MLPEPITNFFNIALLHELAGNGKLILQFRRKQIIFSQGDPGDSIFYLASGQVKLTITSEKGRDAIIGVFSAGAFLGESCVASDQPSRSYTVTALTDVSVVKISRNTMLRNLRLQNQASGAFVSYLVKSIAAIQADLASIILNSSEERLARALVSIAPFRHKEQVETIPRISQQTLADMIGTTRQHINLLMKRFRALGFIDYANGLKIHGSILNVSSKSHAIHTSQKRQN
jgi:CRP/FNR family cyclic AMP-dependent transcriptional regulator